MSGTDPDAGIGYCASKKRAYIGYKCHLVCSSKYINVLDFKITPANVHDSKVFIPLISGLLARGFEDLLKNCYGDNAYDTRGNRDFCVANDIKASFHSKDETGKNQKKKTLRKKKIEDSLQN
ncbi:MAG: transposase [Promethearchaeota archaeon]